MVVGAGGRASRALSLLLQLALLLAALQYLFGFLLDDSSGHSNIPLRNATKSYISNKILQIWPKILPTTSASTAGNKATTTGTEATRIPQQQTLSNRKINKNSRVKTTNKTIITVKPKPVSVNDSTSHLIKDITKGIKKPVTNSNVTVSNTTKPSMPLCAEIPPNLGPVKVNKNKITLKSVEKKYPEVQLGGRFSPPNCTARHRVAIVVPYRDRQQHLAIFLNHMHPFLMKQQIEYGIFIVEQEGKSNFNRAKLFNVGFVESQKQKKDWQCFIFHDIDLLPLDSRNLYSCPKEPRHMSASIDKMKFKLPYENIFGGVSAMTVAQMRKVNGFSNHYWGWGGEDDDMFRRIKKMKYKITRYNMTVARYSMLDHKKSGRNPKRYKLLSQTNKIFQKDGLSTLKYKLRSVKEHHLYTHLLANIDEKS